MKRAGILDSGAPLHIIVLVLLVALAISAIISSCRQTDPPKPEPTIVATVEKPIATEKPAQIIKPIIITVEKLEKIGYLRPYWQVRAKHEDGAVEILQLDNGLQAALKEGSTYEVECTGVRASLVVTQSYRYINKIVREIK